MGPPTVTPFTAVAVRAVGPRLAAAMRPWEPGPREPGPRGLRAPSPRASGPRGSGAAGSWRSWAARPHVGVGPSRAALAAAVAERMLGPVMGARGVNPEVGRPVDVPPGSGVAVALPAVGGQVMVVGVEVAAPFAVAVIAGDTGPAPPSAARRCAAAVPAIKARHRAGPKGLEARPPPAPVVAGPAVAKAPPAAARVDVLKEVGPEASRHQPTLMGRRVEGASLVAA